jgi:lipopolysaccharide export system permease protein
MSSRLFRPLDRYIFGEFWKIFVTTALGFPVLVEVIDLTDNLAKYLNKNLPKKDIALSYLYWLPDSMFMVLPAAVLFATVFSIGAFTRHSEITAAKASGISFFRLIRPIFAGAVCAALVGLGIGALLPSFNARRAELLQEEKYKGGVERYNFAYASEGGRAYKVTSLNSQTGAINGFAVERKGSGPAYPTTLMTAIEATYQPSRGWLVGSGSVHVVSDRDGDRVVAFDSLVDRRIRESPGELMATPRDPQNMGFSELGRFIHALERSGGDANVLRVERALKIAVPVTCIIIVLFGAPLATSTQRGGAAYGVGVSLATTVIFLMMIQMTKAIGGKGLINPDLAAWIPNVMFGLVGSYLLSRVRT